jgi:uncharacterized protein
MKPTLTATLLFFVCAATHGQSDSLQAIKQISDFQEKLNAAFRDPATSPFRDGMTLKKFCGHDFFAVDLAYRVKATLTVTEGTPFFGMKTSTSRVSTERVYGYVNFTLKGKAFRLPVYQSKDLMQTVEYADYLFFPFTDTTNGEETYAGGRYIDLRIPKEGDELIIDFNMAYNPLCAYASGYSCPIVPAENDMDIDVLAGVKY